MLPGFRDCQGVLINMQSVSVSLFDRPFHSEIQNALHSHKSPGTVGRMCLGLKSSLYPVGSAN